MNDKAKFQDYVQRVTGGADDGFITKQTDYASSLEANANFVEKFDPEAAGMLRANVVALREVVAKHQRLIYHFKTMQEKGVGALMNVEAAQLANKR